MDALDVTPHPPRHLAHRQRPLPGHQLGLSAHLRQMGVAKARLEAVATALESSSH